MYRDGQRRIAPTGEAKYQPLAVNTAAGDENAEDANAVGQLAEVDAPACEERLWDSVVLACYAMVGLVFYAGRTIATGFRLAAALVSQSWLFLRSMFGRGYATIDSRERVEMLAFALGLMGLVPVTVTWLVHRPFAIFGVQSLERLGLNTSDINADREVAIFGAWGQAGDVLLSFLCALAAVSAMARLILLRPRSLATWRRIRYATICLILVGVLTVNVLPPFVVSLRSAFAIRASNATFLTSSASARAELNDAIGYSFAGIFFSYLAVQLFFMLLAVTPAFYLAACYVCTRIAWRQRVSELVAVETCFKLRLTLCVILFLGPVSTAMPVIILYQSFGLSSWMLAAWLGSATYPFAFFYHFRRLLNRTQLHLTNDLQSPAMSDIYSSIKKIDPTERGVALGVNAHAEALRRVRREIWINMAAFVVCYAGSTALLIMSVSVFKEIDLIYPAVLSGSSLLIFLSASMLLLLPEREDGKVRFCQKGRSKKISAGDSFFVWTI